MQRLLPFILIIFMNSCGQTAKKSAPPLAADRMELILLDLQFADVYSTLANNPDSAAPVRHIKDPDSLNRFYAEIFRHHGTTEAHFLESMEWYEANPAELVRIYEQINEKLTGLSVRHP